MTFERSKNQSGLDPLSPSLSVPPGTGLKQKLIIGAVLLAVLGAIAYIVLKPHGGPGAQGRHAFKGPVPVVGAVATAGDIGITLDGIGTVTPLATVTVKTQIAGQLVQVAFQEGQMVKAGDFIAQIDPRPYQAQLDQYLGQLKRDQALLKEAIIDLERYRVLVEQDSIAKQTFDTQASLVDQYRGTVATDQAMVDTAKLNLTYCHIVAPVTGRVGLRLVDQGNYVQPSDSSGLVVITQIQPISVVFPLPEDNLPAVMKQVRTGQPIEASAYNRDLTEKLAVGTLSTIDNEIDPTTGRFKLRALFDNTDQALFPDQFVNVRLLLQTLHNATLVPVSAVQHGQPGAYVYLVKDDNTVAVRPVTEGPKTADVIDVLSGVKPGDTVVVDGADKLRDGAEVSVTNAETHDDSAAKAPKQGEHGHRKPQ
jgi:multidrug efflux system membrane fusion protein